MIQNNLSLYYHFKYAIYKPLKIKPTAKIETSAWFKIKTFCTH